MAMTRHEYAALATVVRNLHKYAAHETTGRQVATLAEQMIGDVCAHNVAFNRERFSQACQGRAIPVVHLDGREATVRLISPAEADRLEAAGEIIRQAGLVVQRPKR